MDWNRYRFLSLWDLPAPPDAVYAALEQVEEYPAWWPQVREVRRAGAESGILRVRALLPYELVVTAEQTLRDPAAGVLQAALSGDLVGWSRWTVAAGGRGTLARYDQVVDVTRPLLRRLAVPGRPFLRLNHRLMMASGRRGLAARLRTV
ncbi:SRPBCC family protein [Streptomyces tropicalis]|uniref:SRPBCC family protein n=1 Tax=Streptomyces tropicalis TaxID=3034234 RepID=A0ABT6A530_9ACTN|nr:SRPBCC family protein [Streptomyces tropicalis]MDF3299740.1 SRPBCC family protein [Streptomyces tropicalis]